MDDDGSVVLSGYTDDAIWHESSGGGRDFAAVKLGADGEELWRWQVNIMPAHGTRLVSLENKHSLFHLLLLKSTREEWASLLFC